MNISGKLQRRWCDFGETELIYLAGFYQVHQGTRDLFNRVIRVAPMNIKEFDLLDTQAAAWNAGDFEAFCAVYAEDATYVSETGVVRIFSISSRAIAAP